MKKILRHLPIVLVLFITACGHRKTPPREKQIVVNERELEEVIKENIAERLDYVAGNDGQMEDSVPVRSVSALQMSYSRTGNAAQWSKSGAVSSNMDSLIRLIGEAANYGLVPAHYHSQALLEGLNQLKSNKEARKDAALWAKMDVMLTDAFFKLATHLHYGVAPRDSVTFRTDSTFSDTSMVEMLSAALADRRVLTVLHQLEPRHQGYVSLREALVSFQQQYGSLSWDTLPQTYTDTADFRMRLAHRLVQSRHLDTNGVVIDTNVIKTAVKAFQKEFNMYPDGVAGKRTVQALNRPASDWVAQVALNLDRWRKLPDTMTRRYIWVNIPGYRMDVFENDTLQLSSRVIVGTPRTRTPILNSTMTNFVLYPYWRVPYSIVFKEMLPAIKKDVGYLASKNLEVVDKDNQVVSPDSINWSKLGKGNFPYVLRQMDGLDNSLGIMKFNFANKYSVYLHDTNNRRLFNNAFRSLSHGCVRVQQWDSLAHYLVRNDPKSHDSIRVWLDRGEKKAIPLTNRIAIYLRYFTAEGIEGKMQFYDDIYGEDKVMRKYLGYK
ncbi:L,D-transpeptidase family protein [Chitinophaga horti]|uniref:L,D-transpeptidase family protein n=1 Tax=Chitinophaga horti TaxID=2920382 RepID=A0ABY6IWA0_9BACT|nr:L,D-transpeptidase family protein [Chitinophaga horti]UYQ91641.1 L,D-transpeptidase family protein [Chitinophaga horti]